jgi:Bacterial Ig-like domain (group 3)/FG-GAP-like repeat/FG-GAP repeat
MPSSPLRLRFICSFVIFMAALATAQSSPVGLASQKNASLKRPGQHAAIRNAAPLPPVSYAPPVFYNSDGPGHLAAADLNRDGHLDLVVAHDGDCSSPSTCTAGSVSVLLGDGDGTFRAPTTYSSGGYGLVSVAIGDVNGDGHPDLAVANFCQTPSDCDGGVSIFLGNGDGIFQPPVSYSSGGRYATFIAIGDVNGDGHPDLVVTNEWSSGGNSYGMGVLFGNGDGTFQAPISSEPGGMVGAIEDLNGDGRLDLIEMIYDDRVGVLLGNGDGTFQAGGFYNCGGAGGNLVGTIGDVNGDGYPDLVVPNPEHSHPSGHLGWVGVVGVLLGNGDGTFQATVAYNSGAKGASGIAIADANGDGYPDVVVTNVCYKTCNYGSVSVLLGNGDGTFPAIQTFKVGSRTGSPIVADVNEDGRPDLLVSANFSNGEVAVLLSLFPSTVTASSSPNPSTHGQAVTLTATVSSSAPGGATGTVRFKNGKVNLGKATLHGGVASRTTKNLPIGTLTITASYSGDGRSTKSLGITTQTVQ